MGSSYEDVLQYVEEEDVKFIRLAFCDVFGHQKNIAISPYDLERAFKYGIPFDASAISGFGGEVKSDLFLIPDPATLSLLPWRPDSGKVIRMYCNIKRPDGQPLDNDSRYILQCAIKKAFQKGLIFNFGSEMEFYLFKTDENGNPTKVPLDNGGYMDIAPLDLGENIRREVILLLEKMGMKPESSHHEEGPGQNEIVVRFSEALSAADNAVTIRSVVSSTAYRNGLYSCFTPKPFPDKPGNGYHINFSVKSKDGVDYLPNIIAGVMKYIQDITAFLNTTEESYDRLGKNKAPIYISWSSENRSQLIRIPAASADYRRAELRSPDCMTNPYLAFALIIYAGLEGIEQKLSLPDSADLNLFTAPKEITNSFKQIPTNLDDAKRIASDSEFNRKYLPDSLLCEYCR